MTFQSGYNGMPQQQQPHTQYQPVHQPVYQRQPSPPPLEDNCRHAVGLAVRGVEDSCRAFNQREGEFGSVCDHFVSEFGSASHRDLPEIVANRTRELEEMAVAVEAATQMGQRCLAMLHRELSNFRNVAQMFPKGGPTAALGAPVVDRAPEPQPSFTNGGPAPPAPVLAASHHHHPQFSGEAHSPPPGMMMAGAAAPQYPHVQEQYVAAKPLPVPQQQPAGGGGGTHADLARRRIFVRNLAWKTTTEGLRSTLSRYGDVKECVVLADRTTGKSKGYGFVTYRHAGSAARALQNPTKMIDGRSATLHLAALGKPSKSGGSSAMSDDRASVASTSTTTTTGGGSVCSDEDAKYFAPSTPSPWAQWQGGLSLPGPASATSWPVQQHSYE